MTNETKTTIDGPSCENCKHYYRPLIDRILFMPKKFARCRRADTELTISRFCVVQREGFGLSEHDYTRFFLKDCGPTARFFEPKKGV
jgi:hypothetical protein